MILVELRFLAGRFHATPWGRNVNEGVPEWPPAPFRLARALVDARYRRHPDWSDDRLRAVLELLVEPPEFDLPPAAASHLRAYMHSNTEDPSKKAKILDPFVVVDPVVPVRIGFAGDAPADVRADLAVLLADLGYFGRAESWIEARLAPAEHEFSPNCVPKSDDGHTVPVACLRPPADFDRIPFPVVKSRKGTRPAGVSWHDAVAMGTQDLLDQGWSEPPAMRWVDYALSRGALRPRPSRERRPLAARFRVARYALHSTVPPRIQETVSVAERIRGHLMGIHRRIQGGDPDAVSLGFAGKDDEGRPAVGHRHLFVLPLDEDRDGRIDHVEVRLGVPLEPCELEALDGLRSVWQPDGRPDLEFVLVDLASAPPPVSARRWISATPFVTRRHHRRGRGPYVEWLAGEVCRECTLHGLPEPTSITWTDGANVRGHRVRWMEFLRSRKGERPLRGHGCTLEFAEPLAHVFTLGALCHFGLGLFVPDGA